MNHEVSASPAARILATRHSIDLRRVDGTGRKGMVTKEDVVNVMNGNTKLSEGSS